MSLLSRRTVNATLLAATILASQFGTSAALAAEMAPDAKTLTDAYVYLLGRALVVRQEVGDLKEKGVQFNTIKYNPLGSADFVNPNFDVAYLEAWLAVDDNSAVILEVPEIKDRYYTAQILDEWGEVIANINERTMPTKPFGKFALVSPGSKVKLPKNVMPIILHSDKAKMLGRIELKGDPEGAAKLQHAFKVSVIGKPKIAKPPALAPFENKSLIGVDLFDNADGLLASALDVAPNAAELQAKVHAVANYVSSGKEARTAVADQLKTIVPTFQKNVLATTAPYKNHWLCGAFGGNYSTKFEQRTAANYAGIWANNPAEAIYFPASRDSNENLLDGSKNYVIHFPADALPDKVVDAYWSVILVSVPDYRVIPNDLRRYNFNSYSDLKKEVDGSLKIAIGPKPVAGIPDTNWLPSADGKPFSLTFRTYVPKDIVKTCDWTPAPVTEIK
ncbi:MULTISPECIES: DUF1214 domain-containing protein [unclassified Rhizobium]|nr:MULTISPECIES: DUF1214 domain-containing protein [unclassified Rhizobium]MBX5163228.1 DUF1254 domain-containing protein [Rhizobium sp. NZLR4b]MBX5183855.1 DUF1254 domain-containing protein [Rhizobium sp. NZLR5]MBX5207647.1 DUF1254 domain-containing protein [Rhizobium sp. NZLR11]